PSLYGRFRTGTRTPSIWRWSYAVVTSMYFAFDVGSHRLIKLESGNPAHGMTIDHASTQRWRYTRSSSVSPLRTSSRSITPFFAHSPSIDTFHGCVLKSRAYCSGPSLSVPNS